jgi:hypothetical protein
MLEPEGRGPYVFRAGGEFQLDSNTAWILSHVYGETKAADRVYVSQPQSA